MKSKLLCFLIIALGLPSITTGIFADEIAKENDVFEVVNKEASIISTDNQDKLKNQKVVSEGISGGTKWQIFENGDAVIAPFPESKGMMDEYYSVGTRPSEATGEVIVEEGVEFPTQSHLLFSGYKAHTITFKNKPKNAKTMLMMFKNSKNLKHLDLSSWDTSKADYMALMFAGTDSLESVNLSSFNTKNVTHMDSMFSGAKSLKSLDLSSFETDSLRDINGMFVDAHSLEYLDISSFDTSKVTSWGFAFNEVNSLKEIKLGNKSIFNNETFTSTTFTKPYNGKWIKNDDKVESYSDLNSLITSYDGTKPGTYIMDKTFDVTFNYNDLSDVVAVDNNEYLPIDEIPDPSIDGFTFLEWNTRADGSGDVLDISLQITDNISYYALYSKDGDISDGDDKDMLPIEPSTPNDKDDEQVSDDSDQSNVENNGSANSTPNTGFSNNYTQLLIMLFISLAALLKLKRIKQN